MIISSNEFDILLQHGLPSGSSEYVTMVLGYGRQTRNDPKMLVPDKGYISPIDVIECQTCQKTSTSKWINIGAYGDWYEGRTFREKHSCIDRNDSLRTIGLKLGCFYLAYMNLLIEARQAYSHLGEIDESRIVREGRAALVRVKISDILCIQDQSQAATEYNSEINTTRGIILKVSQLKVLDLIDQLPIIPSKDFLNSILDAPIEWHRTWHRFLDGIQLKSWRDFPHKVAASLQLAARQLKQF